MARNQRVPFFLCSKENNRFWLQIDFVKLRSMDDGFVLQVATNGKEYNLAAKFIRIGYIHQFHVDIDGRTLIFEFDEERNYRVIDTSGNNSSLPDVSLV